MKWAGVPLIVFGCLCFGVAILNIPKAMGKDVSYLIGTFLPGLACTAVGLKLAQGQPKKPPADDDE